ncbi:MAG: hypothetical protein P0Y53_23155 [Candidatus Pseudobacter hemicellulosilyticus]|uniref:Uncharacterized protein n=1 Tax=Candidatus Pseudobacter hemicellulosilyticus TaxID=3121375 RepID=A0AAJ5WR31_9BACT|nr:MAG: hypothetical protein P0Y53_23155 [Pseudobacter sp.]
MKRVIVVFFICVVAQSCGNNSQHTSPGSPSVIPEKTAKPDTGQHNQIAADSLPDNKADNLNNKVLGTWALLGEENATFVIEKKKINYPETFTSYNYSISKDSIHIKYDDYTGSYLIKFKGADTMVLLGDEEQVYYRFSR